jgi:phosphate/sulfate permease
MATKVTPTVIVCGALFGGAFLARTALDWFVPTADFSVRSQISTYVGISLLLATGFWSAWRSGSTTSGTFSAASAALIGAIVSVAGAAAMLTVFHDQQTLAAIEGSGGLAEVFTLPIVMVVPALILGTIGGALGAAANSKLRIDPV